ncbi:MAG: hypothetical protein ACOY0T_18540 [Myxococcota bacterium]
MKTIFGFGIAVALCASGCARHVTLKAPDSSAAPEVRMKAYEELAPDSLRVATYISKYGSSTSVDSLRLNDGRRVYHAEDLVPVIDPRSKAAADIVEMEEEASKARYTFWGGMAAVVAGSVLMIADLAGSEKRGVPFYAGAGLGIGGVIAIPISSMFGRQANEARGNAFLHYDEGLRQRLDLCRDDEEVTPCH